VKYRVPKKSFAEAKEDEQQYLNAYQCNPAVHQSPSEFYECLQERNDRKISRVGGQETATTSPGQAKKFIHPKTSWEKLRRILTS
jgi:hypothetical protein